MAVRRVDHKVQTINGKWLIVDSAGVNGCAQSINRGAVMGPAFRRDDNRLVRGRGRAATLPTKLLVASSVIAALLVLVGVLGLKFLGQANAARGTARHASAPVFDVQTLQTQANELRQLLAPAAGATRAPPP